MKKKKPMQNMELLTEIQDTNEDLCILWQNFDMFSDPDLIEQCIYEINAITSRYANLLKKARQCGLVNGYAYEPRSTLYFKNIGIS